MVQQIADKPLILPHIHLNIFQKAHTISNYNNLPVL